MGFPASKYSANADASLAVCPEQAEAIGGPSAYPNSRNAPTNVSLRRLSAISTLAWVARSSSQLDLVERSEKRVEIVGKLPRCALAHGGVVRPEEDLAALLLADG